MAGRRNGPRRVAWLALVLACAAPVHAQDAVGGYVPPEIDRSLLLGGFLAGHPDLAGRKQGMDAIERGRYGAARTAFLRAARYGDKPSQAMLGEIYWKGLGVDPDPVLGYVWMFLASERGYYEFRAWCEAYWHEMSVEQRQQAQVRGPEIVAGYADAVAVPRLERAMQRELRRATGSMLGPTGQLAAITSYDTTPPTGVDAARFYAERYWRPAEYRELQDRLWKAPLQRRVEVGELEDVSGRGR